MTGELVLGWRLWHLREGGLESLAVNYVWTPGENVAACLAHGRLGCPDPPGRGCSCGFWAVWSPGHCLTRASSAEPPYQVMGLIAAWGTVALHGTEGFRAERAAVRCLFTDRPWRWARPSTTRRLAAWWRRSTGGAPDDPQLLAARDRRHEAALRTAAARYAVPAVSLREAAGLGLLGELGVPDHRVAEAVGLGDPVPGAGAPPPPHGFV
ncbi:MAG TPA: hypothetical protein VOB72_05685 [Candidatus Dormibacteraeota bacterium]|nr:hypothetical protein [Candidatus Dormibacteraeota bacterium]